MDLLHPRDVPTVLTGPVTVDLNGAASEAELAAAAAAVSASSWPSVGVLRGLGQPQTLRLQKALTTTVTEGAADGMSVAVPDVGQAASSLVSASSARPLAARALVQLLRLGRDLDVPSALVAESLAYSMLLSGAEFATWRAERPRRSVPEEPGPAVVLERVGDELTLTLARPGRHNAFSREIRDALVEALEIAVLDLDVHVHLRGEGPSFSSGGDLDEFGTATDVAQAHLIRVEHSPALRIHQLRTRVTAHLHGACIGAGVEVPSFAGHVVVTTDARFQLPELRMGLVPGAGGTVSVTRRIGPWRTAWMVLSGQPVDGTTALEWGLVDELRS